MRPKKIYPDKELWESAGFKNYPEYEYVPLPKEVSRILKRKYKQYVLMSYYLHGKNGGRLAFLSYMSYDNGNLNRSHGCYSQRDDDDVWERLACSILLDATCYHTKAGRQLYEEKMKELPSEL